ncbi:retrotransposon ty1-copia subclass [Nannochloropsis gaditana]|uniref:Retrotransposon ty1-copia subclass n=1 Tax=Nannochloropsis gaditana TaxID=72520 RepID=W7TGR5_9STRA|nr:retrotransposon ty1-copia subclass [Nannochloropsis gaditana]
MSDNDEYRMAIFSGRLEDWDAWKCDLEICNWCRKYGHKETECLVKRNGGGRAGPPHNEKKLGRYERVPGNPYNGPGKGGRISYGRGNGGRGGRNGRGRGKGLHGGNGCRICGSADHWGNECPKNKTEHSYTCLLATKKTYESVVEPQASSVMVDSGATSHMKRDTTGLTNVRQHSGHVYVANGEKLEVCYIGDWLMDVKHSDGVMFKDVVVVPNLSRDLLSMAKIDKAGGKIVIREGKGVIKKGDTCLPIRKVDNMYMLDYYGKSREEANVVSSPELWHQRFGHMNYEYLRQMGEIDGTGVPKGIKKPGVCATFPAAKHKQEVSRGELHDDVEEDDVDSMKIVGAHQKDDQRPAEDDGNIEDDPHQDQHPDDCGVDHVRDDPSQVGATGWKDTDNIVQNMNNMGRTRSKTKAREHHRIDDGFATMGGNLAFAAASEIVNEDCHLTEDESEVRAERRKARDAEYQAHMKNGTWELTTLPKGERCISNDGL